MADVAQLGVEVLPVKGAKEAALSLNLVKEAAKNVGVGFETMAQEVAKAQRAMDNKALQRQAQAAATAIRGLAGYQVDATRATQAHGSAIGSLVTRLALAVGAYISVKRAVDLFASSVEAAGKKQAATTTFRLMVDNAAAATKALAQLKQVQGTAGIFDDEQILRAATVLKVAGANVQNLGTYTQGLAVLAAKAGVSVEQMAQAWVQAVKGRVTSSTLEGNTIMEQLGRTTGKTAKQVKEGLADGTISAKAFTSALVDASRRTDILAERQNDYQSKVQMLAIAWEDTKEAFGKPVIDALGPILKSWTTDLGNGQTQAEQFGKAMAGWIRDVTPWLENLAKTFQNFMIGLRAGAATINDFVSNQATTGAMTGWGRSSARLGPSASSLMMQPPPGVLADIASDNRATAGAADGLGKTNQALDDITERTHALHDATNDFAGDFKTYIEYWKDYSEAMSFSSDEIGRNYHVMQALEKAVKSLGDPIKDVEKLLPGLAPDQVVMARWLAYEEQVERTLKQTELRMKAGMASLGESVESGLTKMTRSWGTWQEQVSNSVGDIGNALASGISSGLADILDGTKSVKDGFRDMAVSIIKDIENIILKMLVQLAIQQLIAAFGGGVSTAGAGVGGANLAAASGFARGGGVPGTGRGDKVPALLEPGEFVIPRDQARRYGYGNLEKIRHMSSGGDVRRMATGGQVTVLSYGGPGEPGQTIGNYNNTLRRGDVAMSPQLYDYYGLTIGKPNQYIWLDGVRYHVADTSDRSGKVIEIWGARDLKYRGWASTGGRGLGADRNPFGRGGGFRSRLPGDPRARRLGFGNRRGGGMDFPGFNPRTGGFDLGDMDRGNRPGFANITGGVPYGHDAVWTTTGPNGEIIVHAMDSGGGPGGGGTGSGGPLSTVGAAPFAGAGPMIGGSPFVSTSAIPTGRSIYSGQPGGFNIPGGIGLSGLGAGSHGDLGQFSAGFARRNLLQIMKFGARSYGSHFLAPLAGFASHLRGGGFHGRIGMPMVNVTGGAMTGGGHGGGGGTQRLMHSYHQGGVIPLAAGGEVPVVARGGEGIFTPSQMRAMAPAGNQQTNNNVINISISNTGSGTTATATGDISAPEARNMARLVVAVVKSEMSKSKRVGGENYLPHSQRGG